METRLSFSYLTTKTHSAQRYGGLIRPSYQSLRLRGSPVLALRSVVCLLFRFCLQTFRTYDPGSGIAIVKGAWSGSFCGITNTPAFKINILITCTTDWVLLALMLIGLLRWEKAHLRGGIWWLLYTQVDFHISYYGMRHEDVLTGS